MVTGRRNSLSPSTSTGFPSCAEYADGKQACVSRQVVGNHLNSRRAAGLAALVRHADLLGCVELIREREAAFIQPGTGDFFSTHHPLVNHHLLEDVLEIYICPADPAHPLVCLDETSRQVVAASRDTLSVALGRVARHDLEYVREGGVNLFLVTNPVREWRSIRVSDQRTRTYIDWRFTTADARIKLKRLYPAVHT